MKKALIIIAAVFAGLILLAIVGAVLPKDPALQVEQDNAVSTPAPSNTMSANELEVYAYIDTHLGELNDLYDQLEKACGDVDFNGIYDCASTFGEISDDWTALPEAGGKVHRLEVAYEKAGNGLRQVILDAVNLSDGKNISDSKITTDITACVLALSDCQDELDLLKDEAQSSY